MRQIFFRIGVLWICWGQASSSAQAESPDAAQAAAGSGITAAASGQTVAQATLVGASGQVYGPQEPGTWTRTSLGGVAILVERAAMSPDGQLFVAGSQTPIYRFDQDTWHVQTLPNRGSVVMPTSGAMALAIDRHVYAWNQGSWKRVAGAESRVVALWAESKDRMYAALRSGVLVRLSGGTWTSIRHPLARGDAISLIVGWPGKRIYAIARSGAVLALASGRARLVARAQTLAELEPQAATVQADGTLWVAGMARVADSTEPAFVLARMQDSTLELVEPLSWIAPGDRVTLLLGDSSGAFLIATRRGLLRYREAHGAWKSGTMHTDLPASMRQEPALGPARTR